MKRRSKPKEAEVRAIKQRSAGRGVGVKDSLGKIASEYGVARSTIKDIAMGYTWRHVE